MTSQTEAADVAKMFAENNSHEAQVMDEARKREGAMPRNITYNIPQNHDIPSQLGAKDVAEKPAMAPADSEMEEPNIQDNQYSIDEPGAVTNHEQTNGVADKKVT
jgi:hypothetical protein